MPRQDIIINCEESDTGEYSVESLQSYIADYIEHAMDNDEEGSMYDLVVSAIDAYKGGAR